jgi:hypothetical protein
MSIQARASKPNNRVCWGANKTPLIVSGPIRKRAHPKRKGGLLGVGVCAAEFKRIKQTWVKSHTCMKQLDLPGNLYPIRPAWIPI